MGQALWVSITSCAAVIAILKNEENSLNIFLILGSIVWIGGFTIEVIADLQKNKFKKNQDTNINLFQQVYGLNQDIQIILVRYHFG